MGGAELHLLLVQTSTARTRSGGKPECHGGAQKLCSLIHFALLQRSQFVHAHDPVYCNRAAEGISKSASNNQPTQIAGARNSPNGSFVFKRADARRRYKNLAAYTAIAASAAISMATG